MNNTVEFVIRMRDMMSGGVNRLSSTSQSAFNRMSSAAQGMTNRNQALGQSFNTLQSKIAAVEDVIKNSTIPSQIREARRELSMLQRMSARHAGNLGGGSSGGSGGGGIGIGGIAMGGLIGGAVTAGATAIASAVKGGIGAVVSKSMEKEQAITGLKTFLGKDGAEEAYKNIRKDADVTPFDTASLLMVNRSLISAGTNAKDARKDTMNLANAVSAVGGGNDVLSRMAANMQQIKTVGKATAMDIRQFGIAGINIYEMLARSTGKNINQVKEMEVTYDDLSKALQMANEKGGIYEGAMAAQSATKFGRWSTIKDKLGNAASDIGDAFDPVFTKLLDMGIRFAEGIPAMLERAKPYIDMLSNGISQVVDFVVSLNDGTSEWSGWVERALGVFNGIWIEVSKIAMLLWNFVSSIIEFIKKSEILKDAFTAIGWIMEQAMKIVRILLNIIVQLWENIVKPILEAIDKAYSLVKHFLTGDNEVKITATKRLVIPKPTDDPKNPIPTNPKLLADNSNAGKAAGDTISGGGPKVINIHVAKFFDSLHFTTLNSTETVQEMENIVMECFSRVVFNGSKMI